jgi:hypothetical protein
MTTMPASSQERMRDENRRLADLLLDGHATRGDEHRLVRAVARHLLDYRTWRSLAVQQGLTDTEAVDLGVRWLLGVAAESPSASR